MVTPASPTFDFTDQVVVITGASRGIGYELSKAFARTGATVVAAARTEAELASLVGEIKKHGGKAIAHRLDLTSLPSIRALADDVLRDFGRVDVLVNNAGIIIREYALDITEAAWDAVMDTNVKGLFFCSQAFGLSMIERKTGRIVNLASVQSVIGMEKRLVYCTSKAAVAHLTRVLAIEWAPHGITVNAVGPSTIETPQTAAVLADPAFRQRVVASIPAGRLGTLDEVVGSVMFLASPAASFINGHLLLVDGGESLW
jgi:NAD(P)-dependent dehydrogenase (short-subunit alcohol dehydrogenase family)